jgi:hypothetical protein
LPFTRTTPVVRCPDWHHRKSVVRSNGPYERGGRRYRRYQCRPRVGKPHYFSVFLDTEEPRPTARWQPPPPCPHHKGSHVKRDGLYGQAGRSRRQRYRCRHETCNEACKPNCRGIHAFTPDLPRAYVGRTNDEDTCAICGEPRNVHHGEHASARRHGWSDLIVARGLIRLAAGETYGGAGEWANRQRPKRKKRNVVEPTGKHPGTAAANNRWHIAADWVEVHGPAVWEPLEAQLRAHALSERRRLDAERAAGLPLRNPLMWMADEHPLTGKGKQTRFVALVVGEAQWVPDLEEPGRPDKPELRLRLARVLPDRTTSAWLLALDELAGPPGPDEIWPDFIVADAATGLLSAIEKRFGGRTRWVPSVWHLAESLRKLATGKTATGARTSFEELEAHLNLLSRGSTALSTLQGWDDWWDELERVMRAIGVKRSFDSRRLLYQRAMAAVIPDLANAHITIASGGMESLIKRRIKPIFAFGRVTFTSVERTNRLTDLAVARDRGWLDDEAKVVKLLRADTRAYGGWTPPPRDMADGSDPSTKARYRSLRDRTLSLRQARQRGLI